MALFTAETPEQYRDAMVNALEDVEKLSSIVRALLLLSQAESGQLVLQKAPLDLSEVAADVVDQFQIPAEEKGVTLTASLDEAGAAVSADPYADRAAAFESAFERHQVHARPADAVRVGVDRDDGRWARLVVEDTGVGIPAENLPHIFDRFYRVRNAQTNPMQGLGLGLSFVAWIVEAARRTNRRRQHGRRGDPLHGPAAARRAGGDRCYNGLG